MKKSTIINVYEILKMASLDKLQSSDIFHVVTVMRKAKSVHDAAKDDIESAREAIFTEDVKDALEKYNALRGKATGEGVLTAEEVKELQEYGKCLKEADKKMSDVMAKIEEEDVDIQLGEYDHRKLVDMLVQGNQSKWDAEKTLKIFDFFGV